MRYNVTYLCSPQQAVAVHKALERMRAQKLAAPYLVQNESILSFYLVSHTLLGNITIEVCLITDVNALSSHMRQHPIDLLVYDERGADASPAYEVIKQIQHDARLLADMWGPDFHLPMSRIVAILKKSSEQSERAFELGRLNIRDVFVDPQNTASLVLWLKKLLTRSLHRQTGVGLALGGGGLEGFLYELGVLKALNDSLVNATLSKVTAISGVSSGAIAGAMVAAQIPIQECIDSLLQKSQTLPHMTSAAIFDFAGTEILKRILKESVGLIAANPQKWVSQTLQSFPTGFVKGDRLEEYLHKSLELFGVEDQFSALATKLFIGATDQDSFEHVVFGKEPWDKVPVSAAIRASIALPIIFMPKQINGRWFIDGQVTKTTDLPLLIEHGCSLIILINPLKPHTSLVPGTTDKKGGIFSLIQTIKALVATRLNTTMQHLTELYPDVDFIVFEPTDECAKILAGTPMRYKIRTEIIDLAYESTLRQIKERHALYSVKLNKYGFQLSN